MSGIDGPSLRAMRQQYRVSLPEVARLSGHDPSHLSRVERGERPVSDRMVPAYQQACEESTASRPVIDEERQRLAKELAERYADGVDIRALAASTGRSYGFVHRLLTESGVRLRQQGGHRRPLGITPLVETLAERFPGQRLTIGQAVACLRHVHGGCWEPRARAARKQHNARVAAAEGGQPA